MMIAAVQSNQPPTSHVMSVARFERFFRIVASLDVDKQDLKRYSDFVNQKLYDLLLRAQAAAKANGRGLLEPFDLPITKGLQECIHEFERLDEEIEFITAYLRVEQARFGHRLRVEIDIDPDAV